MNIIQTTNLNDVPENTWSELRKIFKYCHAYQLKHRRARRFLLSICNPIIEKFNHVLQLDVVILVHGDVSHIKDIETRLQNGASLTKWTQMYHRDPCEDSVLVFFLVL